MPKKSDKASSISRDILEVLPFEIWQRCIAYACHGDHYMAVLLKMTMVSRSWCQLIVGTPTLWAIIHVNDGDEDSWATIAAFLHLSCNAQLSLKIWVPISGKWDAIYGMILPHRDRIRAITLQTESGSHSAECSFKGATNDAKVQRDLHHVFETLRRPTSLEYLDVISDHPIRLGSLPLSSGLVSAGNWLVPLRAFEPLSDLFPRLRHLSISSNDLGQLIPQISAFVQLQSLHLHSDDLDDFQPSSPPTNSLGTVHLPLLNTLRYQGRLYWAPTQLLDAVAPTIRRLELHIGVFELENAMRPLKFSKSLRSFTLMLDYDLEGNKEWRFSKISIPKWRLTSLQDFRCEWKSFGNVELGGNPDSDHLWRLFHTVFPRLCTLVWNLPVGSGALLISLIRQKRLKHFESNVVSAPFSRQPTNFVLNTLEFLRVSDAQLLRGVAIANLLHFSATFREDVTRPVGFTFALLNSLDLTISESVESPCDINGRGFPVLKVLSITFLGARCHLQPLDLPSLTEISISTRSPTFTQAMEFCGSLIAHPENCPRLEQVGLNSFLEWDILHLLLWRRNFLQKVSVSRIKSLILPFLPPKHHAMFVSLLAGQRVVSPPSLWTVMTCFSIHSAQSRLLDQEVIGCFCCVQLGLTDCHEPLRPSRFPEEYRVFQDENRAFSGIVERLGLFPLFTWDMERPVMPSFSAHERVWIEGHQKGVEEWRKAAYEWSKLHHRTLMCHKRLCSPKVVLTEYDIGEDENGSHTSMNALLCLVEYPELCALFRTPIQSLAELLQDQEHGLRSDAATTLAKLAEQVELREAIRPEIARLVELLDDQRPEVRSAAIYALAMLAEYEFHDAIRPAIQRLIVLIQDPESSVRWAAIFTLSRLSKYVGFRNAIGPAISRLIKLLQDDNQSYVRSAAMSVLAEFAEYVELHDAIRSVIPWLVRLFNDLNYVRADAISVVAKFAEHGEFLDAISPQIPQLIVLLQDRQLGFRSATISALVNLAGHGLRDAIRPAIPQLLELVRHWSPEVRSAATSALAKLAQHVEFRDDIPRLI